MRYERVIRKAMTTPWAITPEYLGIIADVLCRRAAGVRLDAEELQALIAADEERPRRQTGGAIGVIRVFGVIANRSFDATSGMTSVEEIRSAFRRAVQDDEISSVLLDIDSPGGAVPGVPELAAEIFAARERKRIVAFIDDLAASAAYYLAAAASEIVSIPTGEAGSIGVYALHISQKGWLEKEGIVVTPIQYGEWKTATAPWNELDPETRDFLQAQVDAIGRKFEADVAKFRGVDVKVVRETFGQGRVFTAPEARRLGMIDRIASFDETVARLGARRRSGVGARAEATRADATEDVGSDGAPASVLDAEDRAHQVSEAPSVDDPVAASRRALEIVRGLTQ